MSATARVMVTRATLHSLATLVALGVSARVIAEAGMWLRMTLFALVWGLCGLAYFVLLYCRQYVLDVIDERIHCALADQRIVDDMRRYQRRLRFVRGWRRKRDETS